VKIAYAPVAHRLIITASKGLEEPMFKPAKHVQFLLVASMLMGSSACASGVVYRQRYPVGDRDDRVYYDRGFREGRDSGADDARRGRAYDLQRHKEFRDNGRGNDRGDVRSFRDGFRAGYDEGYRLYSRGGSGGDPRRTYPPVQNYPRQQGPSYGQSRGRFASPAADNGYRDGFDEGQRAARNGDRFDPVREKRYRDGDHDYEGRYGSRDEYKREYRAAFQQGYEAGYRGIRR
jgi:hypothetical protein